QRRLPINSGGCPSLGAVDALAKRFSLKDGSSQSPLALGNFWGDGAPRTRLKPPLTFLTTA
ncbi:hypothetical protein, partial [Leptolyngbya sp. FACHB-711]|uniref:hypothetical protein n=1 Tax=Leptolyngbya sp. FACHB-711 TaxID=2692813 RepID=UPI001A7E62E4